MIARRPRKTPAEFVLLLNNDTMCGPARFELNSILMKSGPMSVSRALDWKTPMGRRRFRPFRFANAFSEFDRRLRVGFVTRCSAGM